MATEKEGIGIVGLGDGGVSNLRSLLSLSQDFAVKVVAVCDFNGEHRLAASKLAPHAMVYNNVDQLVRDSNVTLTVVATPDHLHLDAVKYALYAGKKVFLEKPVATAIPDLEEFLDLVERFPGKLYFSEKYSFANPIESALRRREKLGPFLWGTTFYTMQQCDRIMGPTGWRVRSRYNPVAGGLSHNFMTALLFTESRIARVRARGRVLTYCGLEAHGGFDTMEGTLEFENGAFLNWVVCLAIRGLDSPFGHRTVTHCFQFREGALVYGPSPVADRLFIGGSQAPFYLEPNAADWPEYNIYVLYRKMHEDVLATVRGGHKPRHTIEQGINVAAACVLAFESAHNGGEWFEVPF